MQTCLLASAKTSILILLYRLFATKTLRVTALLLMAVVFCWWIGTTVAGTLLCLPLRALLDPRVHGRCGNACVMSMIVSSVWIATDLAILFMPLPLVWKLHLPVRDRIALGGSFLVRIM